MVVFGQSLGDVDDHLIEAMRRWHDRTIAISLMPGTEAEIRRRKASYIRVLPEARLIFFDATSHPLGDPALRVTV
jgi:hypothetical protein